jgi:hypothetical protein
MTDADLISPAGANCTGGLYPRMEALARLDKRHHDADPSHLHSILGPLDAAHTLPAGDVRSFFVPMPQCIER